MILAIALSMAFLFIYYHWIAPPSLPPPSTVDQSKPVSQKKDPGKDLPQGVKDQTSHTTPNFASGLDDDEQKPDQELVFENDKVIALVSSKGGSITSWMLKDFHEEVSKGSPLINLLNGRQKGNALVLTLGDDRFDKGPHFELREVRPSKEESVVVGSWTSEELAVEKQIVMNGRQDPYLLDISVKVTNKGPQPIILEPRLWISRKQKDIAQSSGFFSFIKGPQDLYLPAFYVDGKLQTGANWAKMSAKNVSNGKVYWAGITDRYFLAGLLSRHGSSDMTVQYGRGEGETVYTSLSYGSLTLMPGQTIERRFSSYMGPKTRDRLKLLGAHLEGSVDYGWFGFIAIPLLWLLIFFQKLVGNWGVAIIVLTFFVKLLLHPINKKSMMSMKAMQRLQPKLKEMREKYKDDKQRLNQEMMMMFKTHKVNPMGGCLPLFIQMPVYIGLYKVLWNAIELYHVPFVWFYRDLSQPDPYLISPILLGVLMALQQKFTPQTTMDPAQQKMMMIMPIMFSVFMIFFPAGLVIYIFVNTVMSVVQQYMIHREMTFWDLVKKVRQLPNKAI